MFPERRGRQPKSHRGFACAWRGAFGTGRAEVGWKNAKRCGQTGSELSKNLVSLKTYAQYLKPNSYWQIYQVRTGKGDGDPGRFPCLSRLLRHVAAVRAIMSGATFYFYTFGVWIGTLSCLIRSLTNLKVNSNTRTILPNSFSVKIVVSQFWSNKCLNIVCV